MVNIRFVDFSWIVCLGAYFRNKVV